MVLNLKNSRLQPLVSHKALQNYYKINMVDSVDAMEMLAASNFISKSQNQSKKLIGSIELIALENKWISKKQFSKLIQNIPNSNYKDSLKKKLK